MSKEAPGLTSGWLTVGAGVALGAATAASLAVAGSVVYGEGDSLGPLLAIVGASGSLALIYDESPKRWVLALYAALIVSSFFVISSHLRGDVDGAMVLAVAVVAVALPIGSDLVLSDLGRHLEVNRRLGLCTLVSFVTLVLPLTALMLTQAHQRALSEDEDLLREVAQKIRREQDTLIVSELDPSKRTRLQNRVAIRSGDQTYRLSDAEFEKEVREYTVRKDVEKRGVRRSDVSREAEERMRVILKLQGTELPDDVVLVSHRGPMTIVEKRVALQKQDDGAS
jgi:broad specificity phosphatase PhoE